MEVLDQYKPHVLHHNRLIHSTDMRLEDVSTCGVGQLKLTQHRVANLSDACLLYEVQSVILCYMMHGRAH